MLEQEKISINLLDDNPTDIDAFGSHEKTAKSIAHLITSGQHGKSIALLGSWGSGKSSVIKILTRELGNSAGVFSFDAWAHSGDPLRRTFFEELVGHIRKSSPKLHNYLDDAIDRLSKRKKVRTETRWARPTLAGFFYALSIAVAPIGIVIWANSDKQLEVPLGLETLAFWLIWAPAAIVSLALLAFIFSKLRWLSSDVKKLILNIISPLSNQARTEIYQETVELPDPTSVEFQREFCNLMEKYIHKSSKPLAIIIDNLDRVDEDAARSIWATMKTFFDYQGDDNVLWIKKLWLIVPFDSRGINRLWRTNDMILEDQSQSFIQKTFQATFNISEPILSDWMNYFKEQFAKVFIGHCDQDEAHLISRIYRQKRKPFVAPVTPRDIKLFINKLACLYLVRGNEFSLSLIALYCALEIERAVGISLSDILEGKPNVISPLSVESIGQDYRESLLALYYGVPKEKALHVAMSKSLEKSMENVDEEELNNLRKIPKISNIIEDYIERNIENWKEHTPQSISYAALAIEKMDLAIDSHIENSLRILSNATCALDSLRFFNMKVARGYSSLIRHQYLGELLPKHVLSLVSTFENIFEEKGERKSDEGIFENLEAFCEIVLSMEKAGLSSSLSDKISIPGTASTYNRVLLIALGDTRYLPFCEKTKPGAKPNEIMSDLCNICSNEELTQDHRKMLEQYISKFPEYPWENFAETAKSRLDGTSEIEPYKTGILLSSLLQLSLTKQYAINTLSKLASEGHILHQVHELIGEDHRESLAICIYCMLRFNPSGFHTTPIGNSSSGESFFEEILETDIDPDDDLVAYIARLYSRYGEKEELLTLIAENENHALAKAIVRNLCQQEDSVMEFSAKDVLNFESSFYTSLSGTDEVDQYGEFIANQISKNRLINEMLKSAFDRKLANLYYSAVLNTKGNRKAFNKYLIKGMQEMSEEEWEKESQRGDINSFHLLVVLLQQGVNMIFGASLLASLKSNIDNYFINSQSLPAVLKVNFSTIVACLEKDIRVTYLRDARDSIIHDKNKRRRKKRMAIFSPELLTCEILCEKADDLVRTCFNAIIESKDKFQLRWLNSALIYCPNLMKDAKRESAKTFRKSLTLFRRAEDSKADLVRVIEEIEEHA